MNIKNLGICSSIIFLIACQSTSAPVYPPNPNRPKPTQADIASVPKSLVEERCESPDSHLEYEACIAILYAQMPALDSNKRDHFGEKYDREKWYACMQDRGDHRYYRSSSCNVYGLRRLDEKISKPFIDMPEIKWPKGPELPPPSRGMSNFEYFRMLCEKEAGEVIYRTVENVDGLFQMRPAFAPSDLELSDRYVLEDPYSLTRDDKTAPWDVFVQPPIGKYDFLETWALGLKTNYHAQKLNAKLDFKTLIDPYLRFSRILDGLRSSEETARSNQNEIPNRTGVIESSEKLLRSRYGYTWRGLGDRTLRERGIAGGEQVIVDLRTGEVLAWRRSFMYSDLQSTQISSWWMGARHCNYQLTDPMHLFVKRVLIPKH